jgi:hypothetical protein
VALRSRGHLGHETPLFWGVKRRDLRMRIACNRSKKIWLS